MRGHENFLHDEAVVGLSGVWPGFAVAGHLACGKGGPDDDAT